MFVPLLCPSVIKRYTFSGVRGNRIDLHSFEFVAFPACRAEIIVDGLAAFSFGATVIDLQIIGQELLRASTILALKMLSRKNVLP